jgi:hypothetical protein
MYLGLLIRMEHHGYRFTNSTITGEKWKRKIINSLGEIPLLL